MDTGDAKEKAADVGQRLDEALEKVGSAVEEKLTPAGEKLADKVSEATGGSPGEGAR
jgi:hypothetical protein